MKRIRLIKAGTRTTVIFCLAMAVPGAGRSATLAVAPLQPSGPWVLDGEAGECLLQRTYGTTRTAPTIAFRSDPFGDGIVLLFVARGDLPIGIASGHLILSPTGKDIATDVLGDALVDGRRALRISEKGDASPASDMLRGTDDITITIGHFTRSLATPGMNPALTALAGCDRVLVQSWGVDPDEKARLKLAAKPLNASRTWVSPSDYPSNALASGLQGNTRVLYTIGLDGRATDCRTVVSSGNKSLDAVACRSIVANARFTPAQDQSGQFVLSHRLDTVYWRIGL